MSLIHRVLASTHKGLSSLCLSPSLSPRILNKLPNLLLPICYYHLISNNLVQKLIKEPNSNIKTILDSEENSILQSFGFSWNALLSALNSASSSKANLVLEWRLDKLLKHNEKNQELYTELISLCGETRNLDLAMRIFMAMESAELKLSSDIFNTLISVSLLVGNELTALSLFEIMERSQEYKPNSRTYYAFISMYSRLDNVKAMEAWASAKSAAGFLADLQSYDSLISGFVNAKSYDRAKMYYEEMISLGFIPNANILDKMVYVLCQQQDLHRTKEFLLKMIDNGWKISAHIVERVSGLYSNLGKIEEIEELLQILTASKESPEVMSRVHCGIIGMHARADRLDDMEYAVGRMLKQGVSFKSDHDVNGVIRSYFRRAAYDRLALFLEHIKASYEFTKSTHDLLVTGYHEAGKSKELENLLRELDGIQFIIKTSTS